VSGHALDLVAHRARRAHRGAAADHRLARRKGAEAERRGVGVAEHHAHALDGQRQLGGDELRDRRLQALPL
jgi:hypothetical protein